MTDRELHQRLMDKMKVERCWLCGKTAIYESGLCSKDYWWAEENFDHPAGKEEIQEAYDADMEDRFAQGDWELGPGYSGGKEPTQKEWEQYCADEGPHGRIT